MRIGIINIHHPPTRLSPVLPEVVRHLREWDVRVTLIYPEEQLINLSDIRLDNDLYVLKSGTDLALSFAGILHTMGAAILNPYPIMEILRNKIVVSNILRSAGVPIPESFVTAHPEQLAPLLDSGPLVLKPYRGSQGRGVHVVWDADELSDIPTNRGPVFAQRYYQPEGRDRKIYCIDGKVYGVQRVWPARTYEEKLGEPFTITTELHEIALRCGTAFGLQVYGLDVIVSEGRPIVVDFNGFPGFKGVPDAALRLADYFYTIGERVLTGEPVIPSGSGDRSLDKLSSLVSELTKEREDVQ